MKRNSRAVGSPVVGLVRIFLLDVLSGIFGSSYLRTSLVMSYPQISSREERWVAPKALSAEGKHFLTSARVE
jgi:hypothetical protein